MKWFIDAMREAIEIHGRVRTALLLVTAPIRLPLIWAGVSMIWLGGHLAEDHLGGTDNKRCTGQGGTMKSKPYSVLLLYPDYLAENYGEDTYYTYVRASAPAEAATAAQREVADVNGAEDSAADFLPLLCIEGHHEPLPVGSWPLPKTRKRQMNIEACVTPALLGRGTTAYTSKLVGV